MTDGPHHFEDLLSRIKGELRTALKGIDDQCRYLLLKCETWDLEEVPEDISTIREHANLAIQLVNRTLTLDNFPSDPKNLADLRHDLINHVYVITEYCNELETEFQFPFETPELDQIYALGKYLDHLIQENLQEQVLSIRVPKQGEKITPRVEPDRFFPSTTEVEVFTDSSPLKAATLLVVDDEESIRNIIARKLKQTEPTVRVLTASGGKEALELVEMSDPDLMLLDVMMPDLTGIEVLRTLRKRYSMTRLPVIISTGRKQSDDVVEAFRSGANDYVTKPLDFPVVLARIATQLQLRYAMEEIEKRNIFIRSTLGRFLTDSVVDKVLNDPQSLRFEGVKQVVSVLMSDLRGFTSLSERLSPEQVLRILNVYLGAMIPIIDQFEGTIDEIIGDALLVLFGAPVQKEDDSERAVACALAMQNAMKSVNRQLRSESLPEIEMGIGINTGEVVVGTIGTMDRSKYGVVGRHVNLAARVESCTVGGQVLISENTRNSLRNPVDVGKEIQVQVKGFEFPIRLFEIRGIHGKHEICLPPQETQYVFLRDPIPLEFTSYEGKIACGEKLQGKLVAVSEKSGLIRSDMKCPLDLTNIRVRILDSRLFSSLGDIYGKVIQVGQGTEQNVFHIYFTDLPEKAERYLGDLRHRGVADLS